LYPRLFVRAGRAQARVAFRARDHPRCVHDELTADEALEARASEQRVELLLQRSMQRSNRGHSWRNTPVTRPRT
jgi:hypothetical protein